MKKILILGTAFPQVDLILECKNRDFEVFACSYRQGDHGEKYADHFECINIVDKNAVLEYAKANKIDYIYSAGSDIAMPTATYVSEQLGLPHFCSSDTAHICNHKTELRQKLGNDFKGNLSFQRVSSLNDELKINFPFMMKPTDSQGQRGVALIRNQKEYEENFERSVAFSREKALILEEYVEGQEISVNTFSVNGKIVFSLVSDRIIWDEYPGGIIHKHIIPSKYSQDNQLIEKIQDLVKRTLCALKIENGPAYFQIIVSNNKEPKLIEVTPRLDGCHMWRLIKMSTGVDLLSMSMDLLEGKTVQDIDSYTALPYMTEFLCLKPDSIFGKSEFAFDNAEYLEWYYEDGDIVRKMNGYMEKCGYYIKSI